MLTYYPVLSVFDISQTDLADPEAGDPSQIVHQLDGDESQGILTAAADWLTGQGWSFEREQIPGSVNGYTTTDGTQRVVVDAGLSPRTGRQDCPPRGRARHPPLPTRTIPSTSSTGASRKPRPRAWPTSSPDSLGLDTSAYSIGYVAGWSDGDTEIVKATAARVLKAAHTLADAITQPAAHHESAA